MVGFTQWASRTAAPLVVELLNEVFDSFDMLARVCQLWRLGPLISLSLAPNYDATQRYEQLRIKTLGDCYYCICGAPTSCPVTSLTYDFVHLVDYKTVLYGALSPKYLEMCKCHI